ncbi:MAG: PQQ-binding-like beta-propeller repeat protein [Planctomycetaceae bacterium]
MPESEVTTPGGSPASGPRLTTGWLIWLAMVLATQGVPRITMRNATQFLALTLGSQVGLLLLCGWWMLGCRRGTTDRWLLPAVSLLGLCACGAVLFPRSGLPTLVVYGTPVLTLGWLLGVQWERLRGRLPGTWGGVLGVLLASAGLGLVRIEGTDGGMNPRLAWRWRPTAEEQLLASLPTASGGSSSTAATEENPLAVQPGDWPAFRGPGRDGINRTDEISTDWSVRPPRELWRIAVGPGWGSCSVVDGWLFTQQQRGEQECVTAHSANTGEQRWVAVVPTRFEEAISGAGPRGTPTFADGRLYACGANGHLSCHEAHTGALVWSVDLIRLGGSRPYWGYASSPLLAAGRLFVYLGGGPGKGMAAIDPQTGAVLWTGGAALHSYSSPHDVTLHGRRQIVLISEVGVEALDPETGSLIWQHEWLDPGINRDVQPLFDGDDVLISTGIGGQQGWRRLHLAREGDRWEAQVEWFQRTLRPYYNDAVRLGDHVFGFDQNIFTCVSLKDGARKWRAGRYGSGQVLLLELQKLLLVQAENGEVVLVDADPSQHRERGRFTPLDEKTWNHPVVVGGRLYVRNDRELACFDLAAPQSPTAEPR